MTDHSDDLQALWDELNQSTEARQQHDLERRLQQRAAQYATPQDNGDSPDDSGTDVLIFRLGDERYALDVDVVRGVRPLDNVTRVPGVPAFYRGVVNVRGQIRSVLDLRPFFQMDAASSDPRELVLVEAADLHLALLADHIEDVTTIPQNHIESMDMRYARGVTPQRVVLLDAHVLLSDERLRVGQAISSETPHRTEPTTNGGETAS